MAFHSSRSRHFGEILQRIDSVEASCTKTEGKHDSILQVYAAIVHTGAHIEDYNCSSIAKIYEIFRKPQ